MGLGQLAQPQRRPEVQRDQRVEVIAFELRNRTPLGAARVVHEDVEAAEALDSAADDSVDLVWIPEVADKGLHSRDVGRDARARHGDDSRTRRGQSLGDYAKDEISQAELTQLMAGGAELEALQHELSEAVSAGNADEHLLEVAEDVAEELEDIEELTEE